MTTVRQYLQLAAVLLAAVGLALLTSISCHSLSRAGLDAPARTAAGAATALPSTVVKAAPAPGRARAVSAGLCAGHHAQAAMQECAAPAGFAPDGTGGQPQHRLCGNIAPRPNIATTPGRAGVPVIQPLPRDQFPGLLRV